MDSRPVEPMCLKSPMFWKIQGLFLHNQSLIVVEDDNLYQIERSHYILPEKATLTQNPLCHWSEYQYSSKSFKDKLNFVLLQVHSLMDGFVFQDEEFFVHYIKDGEYSKAFKALYRTTFFTDETQGRGMSFYHFNSEIRAFYYDQSEFYC